MFLDFLGHRKYYLLSLYPPFLGAGVRVVKASPDGLFVRAKLGLHWWNKNDVGTQFGGSLYSLCDPFLMLIWLQQMGRSYIVWDKAARIEFVKPGKGPVTVDVLVSLQEVNRVKAILETERKVEREYLLEVKDGEGEVVARVIKTLYVRKKENKKGA